MDGSSGQNLNKNGVSKNQKTSKSVSGVNSDGLTEKSKTSGLIQSKDFFVFLFCFTYAYKC